VEQKIGMEGSLLKEWNIPDKYERHESLAYLELRFSLQTILYIDSVVHKLCASSKLKKIDFDRPFFFLGRRDARGWHGLIPSHKPEVSLVLGWSIMPVALPSAYRYEVSAEAG
jgi:hypothetical protein